MAAATATDTAGSGTAPSSAASEAWQYRSVASSTVRDDPPTACSQLTARVPAPATSITACCGVACSARTRSVTAAAPGSSS